MIKTVIINDTVIMDVEEINITISGITVSKKVRDEQGNVKQTEDMQDIIDKTWIDFDKGTSDIMFVACDKENITNRIID